MEFARELLRRALTEEPAGFQDDVFFVPSHVPPETAVASLAFAHHASRLVEPRSNRGDILRALERVMVSGHLREDDQAPFRKRLVERLRATLAPNTAPFGTLEWTVNDLVNSTTRGGRFYGHADPRYQRLESVGIAAIPVAIDHLGDYRLTRGLYGPGGASGPHIFTVDDLVAAFLGRISGGQAYIEGGTVTKASASRWWQGVKHLPEEEFLVRHAVLPKGHSWSWSDLVVRMVGERYPHRLPELFVKAVEERSLSLEPIAAAIARSRLEERTKLDALVEGARNADVRVQLAALQGLKAVSSPVLRQELLRTIRELPTQRQGLVYDAPGLRVVQFLNRVELDEPWTALTDQVRQFDPDYRIAMIREVIGTYGAQGKSLPLAKPKLRFLAAFLDDAQQGQWPYLEPLRTGRGGHYRPKVSVQNVAAERAGLLLGIPSGLLRWEKASSWEVYRSRIAKAIAQALREPASPNPK